MKQSRNFCFTDNKNLDWKSIYDRNTDIIRYICVGMEVAPKTGKLHSQGWIQFFKKKTLGGVTRSVAKGPHYETCRGSAYDNDKYCKKDGKHWSAGQFIKQGQRTDLNALKELIDSGGSMDDVAQKDFNNYLGYRRGLEAYKQMQDKKARKAFRQVEVIVLSGPTGTGKTRTAMEEAGYKITGQGLKWWDGYDGEKTICIDEYNNDVNITQMLNILDGYRLRLPVKGGFTWANWTKVYITTNLSKDELHGQAKSAHRSALFRRISQFKELP